MSRVLIVDDDPLIRGVMRLCLETAGHEVVEAADGFSAVAALRGPSDFEVMVVDHALPEGDGSQVIRAALHLDPGLACVMCTAVHDVAVVAEAMAAGAVGFLAKPFRPEGLLESVDRAAERRTSFDDVIRLRLLNPVLERFVSVLSNTIEARDATMQRHCERLAGLADELARRMGLNEAERSTVRYGASLHDVGKVAIPDDILGKSQRLTDGEWDIVRSHSEIGARLVADIDTWIDVRSIVRHHHERYDGRGYPDGLSGTAIPLGARIVAVVDAYDVMRRGRSYRAPRSLDEAMGELYRLRERQFDPDCVVTFLDVISDEDAGDGASIADRACTMRVSGVGEQQRFGPRQPPNGSDEGRSGSASAMPASSLSLLRAQ